MLKDSCYIVNVDQYDLIYQNNYHQFYIAKS